MGFYELVQLICQELKEGNVTHLEIFIKRYENYFFAIARRTIKTLLPEYSESQIDDLKNDVIDTFWERMQRLNKYCVAETKSYFVNVLKTECRCIRREILKAKDRFEQVTIDSYENPKAHNDENFRREIIGTSRLVHQSKDNQDAFIKEEVFKSVFETMILFGEKYPRFGYLIILKYREEYTYKEILEEGSFFFKSMESLKTQCYNAERKFENFFKQRMIEKGYSSYFGNLQDFFGRGSEKKERIKQLFLTMP